MFAIAYEIEAAGGYSRDDIMDVQFTAEMEMKLDFVSLVTSLGMVFNRRYLVGDLVG